LTLNPVLAAQLREQRLQPSDSQEIVPLGAVQLDSRGTT
jgi:hypothetical protein